MPVLRLRSITGARRGQEFSFSGPRVRIGRSRDNDLILPDRENPLAGSHHAEALLDATGAWWIVDGNSINGTLLNGVVVGRHRLEHGDRVTFGDEQFAVAIAAWDSVRRWIGGALVGIILLSLAGFVAFERQQRRAPFEEVAALAAGSTFMVALEDSNGRTVVGTAFAVSDPDRSRPAIVLVTNAHVGALLEERRAISGEAGVRAIAVQGDTYSARRIVGVTLHPDWRADSIEKDVALLRLETASGIAPLALADRATTARLARGTSIASFGFPAVSTDPAHPRGRLSADVVGDIRGDYLQVGLGIAPGTSGSPVFDLSGKIVGIVAGGDFVKSPGAPAQPSGTQANWALGVSAIRELLALTR